MLNGVAGGSPHFPVNKLQIASPCTDAPSYRGRELCTRINTPRAAFTQLYASFSTYVRVYRVSLPVHSFGQARDFLLRGQIGYNAR